jgi:quinol monooxygenase YgiN
MVRDFIVESKIREQAVPSSSQTVVLFKMITAPAATSTTESTGSEKLTVEQWREIAKRDKARQKAYYEEYKQKVKELQESAGVA